MVIWLFARAWNLIKAGLVATGLIALLWFCSSAKADEVFPHYMTTQTFMMLPDDYRGIMSAAVYDTASAFNWFESVANEAPYEYSPANTCVINLDLTPNQLRVIVDVWVRANPEFLDRAATISIMLAMAEFCNDGTT